MALTKPRGKRHLHLQRGAQMRDETFTEFH
jgi:hypothetical protein